MTTVMFYEGREAFSAVHALDLVADRSNRKLREGMKIIYWFS